MTFAQLRVSFASAVSSEPSSKPLSKGPSSAAVRLFWGGICSLWHVGSNTALLRHSLSLTMFDDSFLFLGTVMEAITENKTEIVPVRVTSAVNLAGSRITSKQNLR